MGKFHNCRLVYLITPYSSIIFGRRGYARCSFTWGSWDNESQIFNIETIETLVSHRVTKQGPRTLALCWSSRPKPPLLVISLTSSNFSANNSCPQFFASLCFARCFPKILGRGYGWHSFRTLFLSSIVLHEPPVPGLTFRFKTTQGLQEPRGER